MGSACCLTQCSTDHCGAGMNGDLRGDDVVDRLQDAFGDVTPPERGKYTTHSCGECSDLEDRLYGRHWSELEVETLLAVRSQLPLLSDGAFRFFLPGLAIASVRHYGETDTLTHAVLSEILSGRYGVLDTKQLAALSDYARYVNAVHGSDFPDGLPAEVASALCNGRLPSEEAVEQADAADEVGASDGASPLICVFGGREVSVGSGASRMVRLVVLALLLPTTLFAEQVSFPILAGTYVSSIEGGCSLTLRSDRSSLVSCGGRTPHPGEALPLGIGFVVPVAGPVAYVAPRSRPSQSGNGSDGSPLSKIRPPR